MNRFSIGIAIVAALALSACGGGRTALSDIPAQDTTRPTAALTPDVGDILPDGTPSLAYQDAQWQEWLANPGQPGVDYDPSVIEVGYTPAALSFRHTSAAPLPAGESAEEQPLSVLRQIPGYETITDEIASRYPVSIRRQVYYDQVTFASFTVNDGADAATVLKSIRKDFAPYIDYAAYSMLYHAEYVPNDPYIQSSDNTHGRLWYMYRIDCPDAWNFTKGSPTERMADVDTGIRMTHQELVGQVIDPADLLPNLPPDTYFDVANQDNTIEDISSSGHGTFIAGILAARGDDSQNMVGMAYEGRIIPVKISNGDTANNDDLITGCLLGFAAGARAVNLSWGGYSSQPAMRNMVNTIYAGGGLLFSAAGNDNTNQFHYPSDYGNAVCVGSTDPTERRAGFSNYSTGVDIAAPGIPITSTGNTGDSAYFDNYVGTSFSSPMVAAAAALLWSYKPDLTNDEVRLLLETTGDGIIQYSDGTPNFPVSDPPIKRLNVGAALAAVDEVRVEAPQPDAMIQHGTISLTPVVHGAPDSVDCMFNGVLVGTKTSEPYTFNIDTTSVDFGTVEAEFVGHPDSDHSSATVKLVVDNTEGTFPLAESFESGNGAIAPVDLKGYSLGVLKAAKAIPGPGANWTQDEVASQGPAFWHPLLVNPYDGLTSMLLSTPQNSYGSYELDALISERIKLTSVPNPTVVFYQHYNIEDGGSAYDKGWVYVTDDYGATLHPAKLKSGGDAYFTGYQANWTKAEIDLSEFTGVVNLVLMFESDGLQAGEQAGAAGWWVDKFTVSSNYSEDIPTLTDLSIPFTSYGTVPARPEMDITVGETQNVNRVRYILDVEPVGELNFTGDTPDIIVDATVSPFDGALTNFSNYPNQRADLIVQYFDADNNPGPEITRPVYIFNQLGDVNADNIVDAADSAAYNGMIGLTSVDPGYIPLFDSDMDGVITESDAAAVGYFWGESK